jgi:ATP/maltotriose-dependent transcriptional regulator MalT
LLPGPLRLRIEDGPGAEALRSRARSEGLVLAGPGEEADLVARAVLPPPASSTRIVARAPRLSRRELEILGYLADGWSNAEIASVLHLGLRTVRSHLESLYGKLGVGRRGEAVREALGLGLIRLDF